MSTNPRRIAALTSAALAFAGLAVLAPSAHAASPVDIQIIGSNDFHGRLQNETGSLVPGAAVVAGAVKQLRTENPNTIFAAAGDIIGATLFDSFIDKDKPTIDAMNEAGLDVSSVGNHEFDKGYDDLVNRVMKPYDATTNPQGGANWQYLGANVKMASDGSDALAPSWVKTVAGVDVGFIGAVTEELPSLVSPDGIAMLDITPIVAAVNQEADDLKAAGADVIVLLVHEGGQTCDDVALPTTPFGAIVAGVNSNVNAIISGHTHQRYDCNIDGRPVVSAGQYGTYLDKLVFTVDADTGELLGTTQSILQLKAANAGPFNYPEDTATAAIVTAAHDAAATLGSVKLGEIAAPFARATFATDAENRGGESTLGNLVAEVQRWATSTPERGAAQIAFMNPGGLRTDMVGDAGPFPKGITYAQAANVQPFANTLVNMDLTGAQIKAALNQQVQPDAASRSFLRLGVSKGFEYTYDPDTLTVDRMWLNGTPIDLAATYSVTVNSFLSAGGDNFSAFAGGTNKKDTGMVDLQAMVDYMDEFANTAEGDAPLPISYRQQAIGVDFPDDAPATYRAGSAHVQFDLTSLSMTEVGAVTDDNVTVRLGGTTLGTFPVETVRTTPVVLNGTAKNTNDESGTASVDVVLPALTPEGTSTLVVEGNNTGTSFEVPVEVSPKAPTTVAGAVDQYTYGKEGLLKIAVSRDTADGDVQVFDANDVLVGTASLTAGRGTLVLPAKRFKPGVNTLRLEYLGTGFFAPSTGTVTFRVLKATPKVKVNVPSTIDRSEGAKVRVRVVAPDGIPVRGRVRLTVMGTAQSITARLSGGKVVIDFPHLGKLGTYRVKVKYLGSPLLTTARTIVRINLVR
ncbi:bifunctional metallophosphatase/5'-nucleotidase [Nocardioides agariphilus]|uniref:Bifunctional metallophosphatase/5'-nucleotidase n=1 Tax=Nocardioides agariphilus TaxID=433664 RepID=A0A930YHD7_9ACTN|nr:bifunctional UDP-sugar hydrolase/5'-nucleotidase [Nocardioides agariphilus]MBF4767007.1 bifunctional metallophosphatase/5'-nucleotidase [Nocardioides agariphilus]